MFDFASSGKSSSKCYVTHGTLGPLDDKQPPTKRKPFSNVLSQPFIHKAELLLPEGLYELIKDELGAKLSQPAYSRVIIPLKELLEGDFFNEYIKKGNILMLSEGRPGVDNVYSLKDGVLILRLDKDSYERTGLVGKPDGVKGKRGSRPRWIIEINLRLPSMLHGKKGFDRIVYAFKNVLTTPVTWLFSDLTSHAPNQDPLMQHYPTSFVCEPSFTNSCTVKLPDFQPTSALKYGADNFEEYAAEIREWIAMVSLNSPRLDVNDKIDPYLSRYQPPEPSSEEAMGVEVDRVTWRGFMSPVWAHSILVQILASKHSPAWFALSLSSFPTQLEASKRDCTILKIPNPSNEYILWELEED